MILISLVLIILFYCSAVSLEIAMPKAADKLPTFGVGPVDGNNRQTIAKPVAILSVRSTIVAPALAPEEDDAVDRERRDDGKNEENTTLVKPKLLPPVRGSASVAITAEPTETAGVIDPPRDLTSPLRVLPCIKAETQERDIQVHKMNDGNEAVPTTPEVSFIPNLAVCMLHGWVSHRLVRAIRTCVVAVKQYTKHDIRWTDCYLVTTMTA
jgi:hypothetical protein